MKKITLLGSLLALVTLGALPNAYAANMTGIVPLGDSVDMIVTRGGTTWVFNAHWRVNGAGQHHICQVKYTANGWATYSTRNANFSHIEGNNEIWTVRTGVPGNSTIEYVITCEDLDKNIRLTESNGVTRTTRGFVLQSPMQSAQ